MLKGLKADPEAIDRPRDWDDPAPPLSIPVLTFTSSASIFLATVVGRFRPSYEAHRKHRSQLVFLGGASSASKPTIISPKARSTSKGFRVIDRGRAFAFLPVLPPMEAEVPSADPEDAELAECALSICVLLCVAVTGTEGKG